MTDEARLLRLLTRQGVDSSDFDLNPGIRPGPDQILRAAAVLVGVRPDPGGARLILTKRASHLKHHPGQVSFPGGKQEPEDGTPAGAALREAQEEIGLHPGDVRMLGLLPPHETVTGFLVTPVLALINPDFRPIPEAGEVAEAFEVPLDHVLNPARFTIERRRWRGSWRSYYTVPWGPYYIWGATARILRGLAERDQGDEALR